MKLSSKLMLILLPGIALSLLLLGGIAYQQLRSSTEQHLLASMEHVSDSADSLLQNRIEDGLSDSAMIANFNLLEKYVLNGDEDERLLLFYPALIRLFASIQEIFPDYYELRLLMPDGYEEVRRTSRRLENRSDEEADSQLFHLVKGQEKPSAHILKNPDNGQWALYVVRPLILRDPNTETISTAPRLRAYLALTIDLKPLQQFVETQHPGKKGFLVTRLPDGEPVLSASSAPSDLLLPPPLAVLEHPGIEEGGYLFTMTHDNGLLDIYSALPIEERDASTRSLAVMVGWIVGGTLLLLSAIIYLQMRRMVIRPIGRLTRISEEIRRGNLEIANPHNRDDEFSMLGDSFELMARSLKENSDRIRFMAYHDSLTGLPNRSMFREYLSRIHARAKRNQESYALLFIDIDNFKVINDTKGHAAGDQLLKEIADRICSHIRNSDYVTEDISGSRMAEQAANLLSRLGGDEFTVLLPDLTDPILAGSIANRLIDSLSQPFVIDGEELYIGASIGISLFPIDSEQEEELLQFADIAMYHAKQQGKNNYQFYRSSMNQKIHDRVRMEKRLRRAIADQCLYLVYQSQHDLSGRMVGMEALLRWKDEELGDVSPEVFIPVAESCGEILAIGEWVIQEACRQQQTWLQQRLDPVPVSVNVSNVQFEQQDMAAVLHKALERHRLTAKLIKVEITESTTMSKPEEAVVKLNRVQGEGVSIALDDFGTGYSSLSYLLRFPIDSVKVDRSFVRNIVEDSHSRNLIRAVISMTHSLGMSVVAEGVETAEQLELMQEMQCDVIQGYLFSRPERAEIAEGWLKEKMNEGRNRAV